MTDRAKHWDHVYTSKAEQEVSWFESTPTASLAMLEAAGMTSDSCVLDVGGGDSHLIDQLIQRRLTCLAVLDISAAALNRARARLGAAADDVTWIASDVTGDWSVAPIDIWHDRAVFHFLTAADDRRRYLAQLRRTLKVGGFAIIATFALDGPEKCSGLPVARYSPESLGLELGEDFRFNQSIRQVHTTPWGTAQSFQYSRFSRLAQ